MGINAIKCEGMYEETGKTGFGDESRTSNDFDGSDLLKGAALTALLAAGTFVAGCVDVDNSAPPTKDAVKYDKDPNYMVTGIVKAESEKWTQGLVGFRGPDLPGYDIHFFNSSPRVGQPVVLHRLEGNAVINDSFNACRVRGEDGHSAGNYILTCENIKHDGIEVGDTVAVYQALEINK